MIGVWAFTIVTVTLAYELTGSASWVGLVSSAGLAPQFLLALYAGKLADRHGPFLPIVSGVVISGLSALVLAVRIGLQTAFGSTVEPLFLTAMAMAFGVGLALSAPAMHSVVSRLVRPEELSAAVALNFVPTAGARTLGPAVGAVAATLLGPGGALAMIAALSLSAAVGFTFARMPALQVSTDDEAEQKVGAAVRYVLRDRSILGPLLGVAVLGAGAEPAITLAPVLAEGATGASQGGSGVVVTAFGIGGALGVVMHSWLSRSLTPVAEGLTAMACLAIGMSLAPVTSSLFVLGPAMILAGCATLVGVISFSVAVQQRCRPDMVGRVMALWVLAFAGARPVAGVLLGVTTDTLGTNLTLLAAGLLVLLGAMAVRLTTGPEGLRPHGRS